MTDREFLIWIYQRLVDVHGEDPKDDYMIRLRKVIMKTPLRKCSQNVYHDVSLDRLVVMGDYDFDDDLYVIVIDSDSKIGIGRPMAMEQVLDDGAASYPAILQRKKALNDQFGKTRIARLEFIED